MAFNCEIRNGVGLVTLTGSLNSAIAQSFRSHVASWFQAQPGLKHLVVDLGSVPFMDSSGLGALIATFKHVTERGGGMTLARPQPNVKMVLEITRTNHILQPFDTLEEALRAGHD